MEKNLDLVLNATVVKLVALLANGNEETVRPNNQLKSLKELRDLIALKMNTIIVKASNLYH